MKENSQSNAVDRNGIVCDIGEHLVCFELSRLELRAVRTAAGAMGVDVIAYSPITYRSTTIQVKTTVPDFPYADFYPRDEKYNKPGQAEWDKEFCGTPLPDFVVLVKIADYSSYQVGGVYVWHCSEKLLLVPRNRSRGACWTLNGADATIKGGRSQQDGNRYPSLYGGVRDALGKIKDFLQMTP